MVALLFFLVCACVGSVVLMAGATGAGSVSSVEDETNRQRYAVSSAADLIMSQMNNYKTMSLAESWTFNYTQSDYDIDASNNVIAGGKSLESGSSYVIKWSADSHWNYLAATTDTAAKVDMSKYVSDKTEMINAMNNADDFGVLRDILAYGVYHHYWNTVSGYSENMSEDPWNALARTEIWKQSDTYSISAETPVKISVDGFPDVYCSIEMDQNFTIYFDLYCTDTVNGKAEKVAEKWLTYAANASVTRETDLTQISIDTDNNFNNTGLSNTKATYQANKSITLDIAFDDGALSVDQPQGAGS
jgi:hypothetical protein